MAFRNLTLLFLMCFLASQNNYAQINSNFMMDSMEIEKGIQGTSNFEPYFKIIHEELDDNNRPTRSVVYQYITSTIIEPNQRQQFQFDDEGNMTFFFLENWDTNQQDWIPVKQENSNYTNGRLTQFLRQTESGGVLVNSRRWMYTYNANDAENQKILQQWNSNNNEWENLSRKTTTYTANQKIETQKMEKNVNGNWQNRKLRTWTWNPGNMQPSSSLFQNWDNSNQEWINDTRRTYNLNASGLWSGSITEKWDDVSQEWNNDMKTDLLFSIGNGSYKHKGDIWNNNGWQPYIQNFYTYIDSQNPAIVQLWDEVNMQYENHLRHRLTYNNDRLPENRIGMQSWNGQVGNWENKDYTRRVTFFWSEDQSTAIEEEELENICKIPNPYYNSALVSCDIPYSNTPLHLEVSNLLGQVVAKEIISEQVFPINSSLKEGLYIIRVLDKNKVYHLEKIFVSQ